tara:strand:+ start:1202 stop:1315 length:114 start_codon:yes stop_codon:yes gene_type:complete
MNAVNKVTINPTIAESDEILKTFATIAQVIKKIKQRT